VVTWLGNAEQPNRLEAEAHAELLRPMAGSLIIKPFWNRRTASADTKAAAAIGALSRATLGR
jgi:hypothetical protein